MEFNELVIAKIKPLFGEVNFFIVKQYEDYFCFQSSRMEATISYNRLDRSCLFEIGKIEGLKYPLSDNVIQDVFGLDLKIDKVSKELFVDNIVSFFQNEGAALLQGDEGKLLKLKIVIEKSSEEYTFQIIQRNNLLAADNAWREGNLTVFIDLIEQMNMERLPSSYRLKYQIAIKGK